MNLEPYRRFLLAHRLTIAIGLAITVALLMTAISISLYIRSGASRLDLSRPGYEAAREQVSGGTSEETFSPTGPMNTEVLDNFQKIYSTRRTELDKLDPFSSAVLDNDSIRLFPPANTTGE